jgi:hypothetical protein
MQREWRVMAHDWMIAQLDAMAAYAASNDLPALAQALREAKLLALTEIASRDARAPKAPH